MGMSELPFWFRTKADERKNNKRRERELECVCVCVCERERERKRERVRGVGDQWANKRGVHCKEIVIRSIVVPHLHYIRFAPRMA